MKQMLIQWVTTYQPDYLASEIKIPGTPVEWTDPVPAELAIIDGRWSRVRRDAAGKACAPDGTPLTIRRG
jgi:hypothetical protein